MKNKIILKNISKIFYNQGTKISILNNINLEFERGLSYGIFGSSGSGKTTLIQIIGLLDKQTSGNIVFEGKDVDDLKLNERLKIIRKEIGFVYQFYYLLEDFTVYENILIQAKIAGIEDRLARKLTDQIISKISLNHRKDYLPSLLSGGEKQRVAIARAIVKNPKILIADEPTGSLDSSLGLEVFDLLLNISKEFGTTLIMVTHNEKFTDKFDKVIKMEEINKLF